MNKIFTLLCACFILLNSFNYTTNSKEKVRIFVAWPGATYLPGYDWKVGQSKPTGIEPTMIERILEIAEYDYVYVSDYNYTKNGDVRIDVITDGVADVSIRSISITDERAKKVNFSQPYYFDEISALVLKNSRIQKKEDLNDKIVYAHNYTTAFKWAKENLPDAKVVSDEIFPSSYLAEELLMEEKVDAYLGDKSFLTALSMKSSGFKVLKETFTIEPFGIAVHKDKDQLLQDINSAIEKMRKSGELEEITAKFKM